MIVVIGEALIDLIEDRAKKGSFTSVVGGANANVAIALARAGTPQQLLARISNDSFGQKIRVRFQENNVGLDYAIKASEPTTLAFAAIGDSGSANYSFYVDGTADWNFQTQELPSRQIMNSIGAKALQFGCLTMAMPPGNKVIEKWAASFHEEKLLTISHDINVRPALGFDAGKEKIRVENLNQISHLIKASDDDITWLYGLEQGADLDQIVWGWIKDSEKIVFVTRGDKGVSIYRKNGVRLEVPSRKVVVQDTVGAGDTFCATTLSLLLELDALGDNPDQRLEKVSNDQLIEVARVAGIAASMACEKIGAEPPTKAELKAMLESI